MSVRLIYIVHTHNSVKKKEKAIFYFRFHFINLLESTSIGRSLLPWFEHDTNDTFDDRLPEMVPVVSCYCADLEN